jgi:hypothetical protein
MAPGSLWIAHLPGRLSRLITEEVKLNDNLDRGKGLSSLQEATVETI